MGSSSAKMAQQIAAVGSSGLIKQEAGLQVQPYGLPGNGHEGRQPTEHELATCGRSDSGQIVSSPREGSRQGELPLSPINSQTRPTEAVLGCAMKRTNLQPRS